MNNSFKVFTFGPCDVYYSMDIPEVQNNFCIDHKRRYKSLSDFNNVLDFRPHLNCTSMRSLYSTPGPIAYRIVESLNKSDKLSSYQYHTYEESMKYPFLEYFKKNVTENDVLVLGLSAEFYSKLVIKDECITLHPSMFPLILEKNERERTSWLFNNYYLSKNFLQAFDEDRISIDNIEYIRRFTADIASIFKDRVILLRGHISDIMFDGSSYSKFSTNINNFCQFYNPSRVAVEARGHVEKFANIFTKRFLKNYPYDIPVVSIDNDKCFIDANHPQGLAPFHFHKSTNYLIGLEIYKELVKHEEKIKSKHSQAIKI